MKHSRGTIILLAVLVLLLITAGAVVFSGFFEEDPDEGEYIKVMDSSAELSTIDGKRCA